MFGGCVQAFEQKVSLVLSEGLGHLSGERHEAAKGNAARVLENIPSYPGVLRQRDGRFLRKCVQAVEQPIAVIVRQYGDGSVIARLSPGRESAAAEWQRPFWIS